MLADGMIAARIRSTVELDGVSQMLEKLHNGGLCGKAVIRLYGVRFPGGMELQTGTLRYKRGPRQQCICHDDVYAVSSPAGNR
jgi:hypothetical protein